MILERYFSVRTAIPEFFAVRDPLAREIQECCDTIHYFVLPSLTDEGHRVTILRLRNTRIEKFSIQAISRRILMVLDTRLLEEQCLSNIMRGAFHKVQPDAEYCPQVDAGSAGQHANEIAQSPFPPRACLYREYPQYILPSAKGSADSEGSSSRFKFCIHTGGGEELHTYMGKDILPNEWGGKAGTLDELNDAWKEKIERNRDWFLREEKLSRTNENARLPEAKTKLLAELDGLQGSFRQLNID
ncbi:unnamed protein product, partial [Heterotrigona itama]